MRASIEQMHGTKEEEEKERRKHNETMRYSIRRMHVYETPGPLCGTHNYTLYGIDTSLRSAFHALVIARTAGERERFAIASPRSARLRSFDHRRKREREREREREKTVHGEISSHSLGILPVFLGLSSERRESYRRYSLLIIKASHGRRRRRRKRNFCAKTRGETTTTAGEKLE